MQSLGEHERLVRFLLGASSGVHLVLARYEHAGVARRARAAAIVAVRAGGREVAQVDFGDADDEVDIVGRLQAANARAPIVFAFGLEGLLLDLGVAPRATDAIARFNFDRDLLPERLHGVVVLWLSYRAARAFASLARDTFDVISTSFDFPELLVGGEGESEFGREFVSMDSLPEWATRAPLARVPELEDRARLLESLYADATPGSAGAAELAVSLGKIESSLGHVDAALEWFERAALDYVETGDRPRAVDVRRWRTSLLLRAQQFELARAESSAALALAEATDPTSKISAQLAVAEVKQQQGHYDEAIHLLRDVANRAAPKLRARALTQMASVMLAAGDPASALAVYEKISSIEALAGDAWDGARNSKSIAAVLVSMQDFEAALEILRGILPVFAELGDELEHGRTALFIAAILARLGEADQAKSLLRETAIPTLAKVDALDDQARADALLAALEREREAASKDRG